MGSVQDRDLVHIWPTRYAHIHRYGTYHVNVEEVHGRQGGRPLRPPGRRRERPTLRRCTDKARRETTMRDVLCALRSHDVLGRLVREALSMVRACLASRASCPTPRESISRFSAAPPTKSSSRGPPI